MGTKISIIGGGRIGKLIIRRLKKACPDINLLVSTKTKESSIFLAELFHIETTTDNKKILEFSDLVFLCIRPDNLEDFLKQIEGVSLKAKTFISLLVVFEPKELEKLLRAKRVCTFHPTTYLHYSEREFLRSFIVFSNSFTEEEKESLVSFLSKAFGRIEEEKSLNLLKEKIFLYGNFPAYLVDLLEKLIVFISERLQVSEKEAKELLEDALNLPVEDLRKVKGDVATPNGITERGLKSVERTMEELLYLLESNTFLKIDKGREMYGKF